MNSNYLITIVGTTAIGKTALSLKLAQHFNTEIISCDSRQFYKEMSIGTAVPDTDELTQAKHHFIQNRSIHDDYSVGDYEKDAVEKIDELFQQFNPLILIGGSGLYERAIIDGLDDFPEVDSKIRAELKSTLELVGIEHLQNQLKKIDPISYEKIDIKNQQRLIRALEIGIGTNKPYSSYLNQKKNKRNFKPIKVGLTAPREIIYDRINQRVDIMIENGLIEEALKLHQYKSLNALQTVGYKELFAYFDGEHDKDFAISEIKKNTRRFAKRQITWFKKDPEIKWFSYDTPFEEIGEYISKIMK